MREKIAEWLFTRYNYSDKPFSDLAVHDYFLKLADQILALLTPSEGELISDEEIIKATKEATDFGYLSSRRAVAKAQARHNAQQKDREIAELFKEIELKGFIRLRDNVKFQNLKAKYLNKP